MPTYTWKCRLCGDEVEQFLSITEYCEHPPFFVHCGHRMERRLQPAMLMNTSDASYLDLRASDGTDISSRAKHRAYMKERGLTTIDDFKETWKGAAKERAAVMSGEDPARKQDIADAIAKVEAGHA